MWPTVFFFSLRMNLLFVPDQYLQLMAGMWLGNMQTDRTTHCLFAPGGYYKVSWSAMVSVFTQINALPGTQC